MSVRAGFYLALTLFVLFFFLPTAGHFLSRKKGVFRAPARETDSHASDIGHWLGMTPRGGVRGDVGIAPYETSVEGAVRINGRRDGAICGGGNFRWASGEKCAILFLFHGREGALCLFAPIYIR